MFDWIKPQVNTQIINVLDVLCHKVIKPTNNSPIQNLTTASLDSSTTIQGNRHKAVDNVNYLEHQRNNECTDTNNSMIVDSSSVNKTDCNNTTPFNVDVFQPSKDNINLCTIRNEEHHDLNKNNNVDPDKVLFHTKHNSYHDEKRQLKKEDKSTDPFVNDHELPLLKDSEKTFMNLTNFYNDAKNQIDDNSESESSLYEMNENSQYGSVTVLKTEPILDNNIVSTGSYNVINNLDNAVFIFQNNLDVSDSAQVSTIKENDSEVYVKKQANTISNFNYIKPDTIEKPSTLKVINLKSALLPQCQTINSTKFNVSSQNNVTLEKNSSNYCNSQIVPSIADPICSSQNKVINSAVNFKYISFPEKNETNKIVLNSKNVKFPIIHMQIPENSLPTLKINDSKKDKVCDDKINDNTNIKYLVKDKNIFKLLYVNSPTVENNVQVLQQQDKCNDSSSPTAVKKLISNSKSQTSIPKLLHFEAQRNSTVDISKVIMKNNDKKNGTNVKETSNSPKQAVNIIYQPTKHPGVLGSKNLIVTFPQTKMQNKSNEAQNKTSPVPSEKIVDKKVHVNPVCAHKIVLVPTVSETSPPIPDRSNPISSTTMEQVREFESVLEKVKKTSQLKEKVPHDEVINTSFIPTNQKTNKNVTAVTLGSILLQPTKIATYTNLIYASDKKLPTTVNNVKQTPIIIAKSEDKTVIQTSTQFPQTRTTVSNSTPSTTSANSTIKPLQKAQEDEQTAEKIYKILNSYTEKIKNAPELKNKPAPRRRSNPPMTNSSKCRKSIKCPNTNKVTSSMEFNNDSNEKETTVSSIFPISVTKAKDIPMKAPVQIQQLTMPLCSTQDNQVVLLTNDKHIILKKIKHVQKFSPSSPIVKPILKAEPFVNNINTQVVHYKIKNDAVHGINLINYVSSVHVNNRASIITTTPSCVPIISVPSCPKVHKFAQETQTDISMECSTDVNKSIEIFPEAESVNEIVEMKAEVPEVKSTESQEIKTLCVALDKHYFRNIDALFFTSFIFLNYPSSQLFMFEATYALSRMIRTNSISNSISKHYTSHQMNELQTFAESHLPLWEKMKIIDDIVLKKKGPHICDTMMIMIKKSDNKSTKENILKNIHEDKIEVNKCNKNPKCYGKKNGINDGSKGIKYPHPLEPTVIITNRPDDDEDFDMVDDSNTYKKMSRNERKRTYQEMTSVNFDEIEIDNPKIAVPKKKKKCNKKSVIKEVAKKNHPTHGGDKEKRKCRSLRIVKKQNFKPPIRNNKMKANNKKMLLRNKSAQSLINTKYNSNSFLANLRNKPYPLQKGNESSNINRDVAVKRNKKLQVQRIGEQKNINLKGNKVQSALNDFSSNLKKISNENKILTRQSSASSTFKINEQETDGGMKIIKFRKNSPSETLARESTAVEVKSNIRLSGRNVPLPIIPGKMVKSRTSEFGIPDVTSKSDRPVDANVGLLEVSRRSCQDKDNVVEISAMFNSRACNRETRGLMRFEEDTPSKIDSSKKIICKKS